MTLKIAALSYSMIATLPTIGYGDEAKFICEQTEASHQQLARSSSLSNASILDDLDALIEEGAEENWDGYGAKPISLESVEVAGELIRALPLGASHPTLGMEPDGMVTMEWYAGPSRVVSLTARPDGTLSYVAIFGAERQFGSAPYLGSMPRILLNLLQLVNA